MKHLIGVGALFSLNVGLLWLFEPGSAIKDSDPVVVAFALYGLSHIEWLMVLAWACGMSGMRHRSSVRGIYRLGSMSPDYVGGP